MFEYLQFLIPVLFLVYGYKFYMKSPAYMDERGGFPTRRARENEEVWKYVQRVAGIMCFVMAGVLAVVAVVCTFGFPDSTVAYWVQIAIELFCVFILVPIVNVFTERKFPSK